MLSTALEAMKGLAIGAPLIFAGILLIRFRGFVANDMDQGRRRFFETFEKPYVSHLHSLRLGLLAMGLLIVALGLGFAVGLIYPA